MRKQTAPQASETRVYLLHARSVERPDGGKVIYPAGYYALEPEQAEQWIRDGLAVSEPEWDARCAVAAKAAAAEPVMHPAGPRTPAPAVTQPAAAGTMWPHGPKPTSVSPQKPAAELPTPAPPQTEPVAAGSVVVAEPESAGVQTPANEDKE